MIQMRCITVVRIVTQEESQTCTPTQYKHKSVDNIPICICNDHALGPTVGLGHYKRNVYLMGVLSLLHVSYLSQTLKVPTVVT